MLCDVNKLFVFKSLLTTPSNVLPLHFKQTFPPIIQIFTEGDGIESRLPFKIFSTLLAYIWKWHVERLDQIKSKKLVKCSDLRAYKHFYYALQSRQDKE